MTIASLLDSNQTAMATPQRSERTGIVVVRPKMRYDAELHELNFVAQQFERPRGIVVGGDIQKSMTGAHIVTPTFRFKEHFTTVLTDAVTWDDVSIQATFSALSEDYDVAAVDEASLSKTKHFGW